MGRLIIPDDGNGGSPVIIAPPSNYIFVGSMQRWLAKFAAADGSYIGKYDCTGNDSNSLISNVLYDGAYVWGAQHNNTPGKIGKIDPATGAQVGTPFNAFDVSLSFAFDGVNYWQGGYVRQALTKFDVNGTELGTVSFSGSWPWILCYDGGANIWVAGWGTPPTKVRISDNNKTTYGYPTDYYPPDQPGNHLLSDGTYVYYLLGNGTAWMIWRLDILTGAATSFVQDNTYYYPRGMTFDGANIWVKCSHPSCRLIKIRVSDGAQLGTYDLTGADQNGGLCCDGTHVWVVRYPSSSIRKIRCSDGAYIGDYGNGSQIPAPIGICSTGGVLPWPRA